MTISDAIRQIAATINPKTGKTHWEMLMDSIKERAAAGEAGYEKLLKRAERIEAAHPEYKSGKKAAEG